MEKHKDDPVIQAECKVEYEMMLKTSKESFQAQKILNQSKKRTLQETDSDEDEDGPGTPSYSET